MRLFLKASECIKRCPSFSFSVFKRLLVTLYGFIISRCLPLCLLGDSAAGIICPHYAFASDWFVQPENQTISLRLGDGFSYSYQGNFVSIPFIHRYPIVRRDRRFLYNFNGFYALNCRRILLLRTSSLSRFSSFADSRWSELRCSLRPRFVKVMPGNWFCCCPIVRLSTLNSAQCELRARCSMLGITFSERVTLINTLSVTIQFGGR